jgi:hypothetical protein
MVIISFARAEPDAGLVEAKESFELRGLNPSKSTMSNKINISFSHYQPRERHFVY